MGNSNFFCYAIKYETKDGYVKYAVNSKDKDACKPAMEFFDPGSKIISEGWMDKNSVFHAD